MKGIVKQTYLLLGKVSFKLGHKKLWVSGGDVFNPYVFKSIDNKLYYLLLRKERPKSFFNQLAIPYKIFIEDEYF